MPTSLKLPPKLKTRIAKLSKAKGKSPHAFMIEALEAETTREELHQKFIAEGLESLKETLESGLAYRAEDVHPWFEARVRGENPPRPKPVRWRK